MNGLGRRLRPGWPLTGMFVGFPLWWVLGLSNFIGFLAAAAMLLELVQRRKIRVPRGFGWWLLFLGVVAVSVVVLQVNAPGAAPGGSSTRYVTWAYRFGWYLAATVALLYVGALRRELSDRRIARSLGAMFLVIAAGGWLGVLAPHLEFPSLLELALPRSVTRVTFVNFLVHPQVSQLYDGAATQTPRPSAPFAYSNIWGLNFAAFLPFFVLGWWVDAGGWRRRLAPVLLALALVPAVQSLNRGLWAAVIASALFVALRSAVAGRVRMMAGLLLVLAAAGAIVVSTPLGTTIATRLDNPTSNDGRAALADQTVLSVVQGSPVVGFGSTRDVQGSFSSIAGGATPNCPLCSPPALGTQGHIWLVVFSQGLLGLLCYVAFYVTQFVRHVRLPSPYVTAGLTVLLVHAVTMTVYDSIGTSVFAIMIGVGLMWRAGDAARRGEAVLGTGSGDVTLGGYLSLVRRHAALVLAATVVGAGGGVIWQAAHGVPAIATISMVLPEEPMYLTNGERPTSMDTEAQFAQDAAVLSAMSRAAGDEVRAGDLYVSANPNTRILNLRYTGMGTDAAVRGVEAGAAAVLALRAEDLKERMARTGRTLDKRAKSLGGAINTLDSSQALLKDASRDPLTGRALRVVEQPRFLKENRAALLVQAGIVGSRRDRSASVPLDAGQVVRPAVARRSADRWEVSIASGLVLGLVGGLVAARGRELLSRRLRRRRVVVEDAGMDVLAELDGHRARGWDEAVLAAVVHRPSACIGVGPDAAAYEVAARLERSIVWRMSGAGSRGRSGARVLDAGPSGRVIIVASRRTRSRQLTQVRDCLERAGQSAVGVVLVDP
jgi:hypothetical protein